MTFSIRPILLFVALAVCAGEIRAADSAPVTVFMIGDSTMADKPVIPAHPERGWGQMLPTYFKDGVRIENHAMNGRSTRSFIAEGRWKVVLERVKVGDYVIIQFGHNDEKAEDPKRGTGPFTDFKGNLARFVKETREHGGTPILATPVSRRMFAADGTLAETHRDYPKAVRQLAEEQKVPLLDLEARSRELLTQLGPERSKALFMWVAKGDYAAIPGGREDNTHFNAYGATRMCDLAVIEMKKAAPNLAVQLREGASDPMKK